MKRRAFLMEIDPLYCDVILERWEAFTGRKAALDGAGLTFDQVAAERKLTPRRADPSSGLPRCSRGTAEAMAPLGEAIFEAARFPAAGRGAIALVLVLTCVYPKYPRRRRLLLSPPPWRLQLWSCITANAV
jgi:hypothetical protein